jgi:23S rRNA (uracil-5-)-methyltransferase RumA
MPSLKHKIIKVKAEKIVFPGKVLCRCEDGIALFTEGLLPDEEAEIFVTRDKKSFREGKLERIVTESPLRKAPQCQSFGKCGGCSFQHTDYINQIDFKTKSVRELLKFLNIEIPQAKQSPNIWNYRNKMEFSFFNENDKLNLGLHCKGSFYKYSSVPPCYIACEDIVKAESIVKDFAIKTNLKAYNTKSHEGFFRHLVVRKGVNTGDLLVNIVTNKQENIDKKFFEPLVKNLSSFCSSVYWTQNSKYSDAVHAETLTLLYGKENINEELNIAEKNFKFSVAPFSFFQTNTKATEVLYNTIIELLQPQKQDTLLDMYCGTGTIGISLCNHVKSVVGVEQIESSIESARNNAETNNINNIEFFAKSAEDWVKQNNNKFDSIVIDPPRAGLSTSVIEHILYLNPNKLIYVSCNPSTLARDLKVITESGKYEVKKVCPVDMFPQTYHIETVVLLIKK